MVEKISTPVSVSLAFDSKKMKSYPKWVVWNGRLYPILKVGLHHVYREGRTLYHVFSVVSRSIFFRLVFNTENLQWRLEEVEDDMLSISNF
jgi:hypothetical protein